LIPVTFQYVANLGGWDEEDRKEYLRAGILGSLNGLFIAGDVIDSVIRQALGLRVWDNEIPLVTIADDVNKAIRKLDFDDITNEDVFAALLAFAEAGTSLGIPVKQTVNMIGGMADIIEGSFAEGLARLSGWSEFRAEKEFKEESSKSGGPKLRRGSERSEGPKLRRGGESSEGPKLRR